MNAPFFPGGLNRRVAGFSKGWAVVLIIVGFAALALPLEAGIAIAIAVAILVIAAGVIHLAGTFAARSSGARVGLARMLVFVVAGAGCGAAGAVLAISQLQVQPSAVFSVQWTAEMAFATIIGGLGTIEGPIIGTVVYMVLQQTLASYNAWYLIILGLVAIVVALLARRGLWGLVDREQNLRLFPVGYWLRPGEADRRFRLRSRSG